MIPLAGQTLNTGHLTQPTASATGHSVIFILPSKAAAGNFGAVIFMIFPDEQAYIPALATSTFGKPPSGAIDVSIP